MWINFGPEDLGAELRLLHERMDRQDRTLNRIERKQDLIMALVAIEQGDLDAIAVTIVQVAEALQAVLDSPTALAPADEAGVQDALTKLKAVGPRVPTDAPPVSTPVEDTPAPDAPVDSTPVVVGDEPVVTDPAAGNAPVTDPAAGDAPVTDPASTPVDTTFDNG